METSRNRWIDQDVMSVDGLPKFLESWTLETYEESTYTALIDVFSVLSITWVSTKIYSLDKEKIDIAKRCLLCARDLATCIQKNSPELIKSRPYMRWILAEETFARVINRDSLVDLRSHFASFPGTVIWISTLPIYIPLKMENPGWPTSNDKSFNIRHLATILKVSQELQDIRMEELCLKELVYHSSEPSSLFDQLLLLQKEEQSDLLGFQTTCLSRFLLVKDETSCRDLIRELTSTRVASIQGMHCPLLDWCTEIIQKALTMRWSSLHPEWLDLYTFYTRADKLPSWVRGPLSTFIHEDIIYNQKTRNLDGEEGLQQRRELTSGHDTSAHLSYLNKGKRRKQSGWGL